MPSHAVTKALEATASDGARVMTMVLGPSIDTEGTMKFSTMTVLAAEPQEPRKLQRVTDMA